MSEMLTYRCVEALTALESPASEIAITTLAPACSEQSFCHFFAPPAPEIRVFLIHLQGKQESTRVQLQDRDAISLCISGRCSVAYEIRSDLSSEAALLKTGEAVILHQNRSASGLRLCNLDDEPLTLVIAR